MTDSDVIVINSDDGHGTKRSRLDSGSDGDGDDVLIGVERGRYHPVGADDLGWVVDKNVDEDPDSDCGLSDSAEVRVMNPKLSPVKQRPDYMKSAMPVHLHGKLQQLSVWVHSMLQSPLTTTCSFTREVIEQSHQP